MRGRMLKPWLLVAAISLLLTAAVACGSEETKEEVVGQTTTVVAGEIVETDAGSYISVSPEELWSMLGDKDFTLVNVLTDYIGEIEGTDAFIPYDEIASRTDELPAAPDSKIVVYCRSGGSSAAAATTLVSLGYTNIWNLDGGMIAWTDAGYPLVDTR